MNRRFASALGALVVLIAPVGESWLAVPEGQPTELSLEGARGSAELVSLPENGAARARLASAHHALCSPARPARVSVPDVAPAADEPRSPLRIFPLLFRPRHDSPRAADGDPAPH